MKVPFEIRDAQSADARDIADLLVAAFEEFEPQYTPTAYAATVLTPEVILVRVQAHTVLVATEAAAIVGTVTLEIRDDGAHVRSSPKSSGAQSSVG